YPHPHGNEIKDPAHPQGLSNLGKAHRTPSSSSSSSQSSSSSSSSGRTQEEREALVERMRTENRVRKKRWRENNEERNKDNDLRCRVTKRAHKLFGPEPSLHKSRWQEEEFHRRREKRREKESRRRMLEEHPGWVSGPPDLTSMPSAPSSTSTSNAPSRAMSPSSSSSSSYDHGPEGKNSSYPHGPEYHPGHPHIKEEERSRKISASSPSSSSSSSSTSSQVPDDFPMDAVLTLMQLNHSPWPSKANGSHGVPGEEPTLPTPPS
ncbi:hypothetical protein BJ684DRAFT_20566, partial [Piptocephalis cylindrospora]